MHQRCCLLFIHLLTLAATFSAAAQSLWDNGPPGRHSGWELNEWVEADDFYLPGKARLDHVRFYDLEVSGTFSTSILWQIYANNPGNTPGPLLTSGLAVTFSHVATGITASDGLKEFLVNFDFNPAFVLPAGTYWLALHNGPANNTTPPLTVFWEASTKTGGRPSYTRLSQTEGPWYSNDFPGFPSELAFQLDGVFAPQTQTFGFTGNTATFSFTSTAGYQYRVEFKDDIRDSSPWATLPGYETVNGTGSPVSVTDPDPNARSRPRRFYRAVLL